MPSTRNHGPGAPTRQAHPLTDYLRANIYRCETPGVFVVPDRHAEPTFLNAVIVKQHADGSIEMEPYQGQPYLAVARVLENYMTHLEPWIPRISGIVVGLLAPMVA